MLCTEKGMHNFHVTLTYNDENLPEDNKPSKRDIQLYHKKLRKDLSNKMLFYLISERGEKFGRIHYHCLYFNVPSSQKFLNLVQKSWDKGQVHISELNEGNIRYVTNHNIFRREKPDEWALMSRRPAIGRTYIELYNRELKYYVENDMFTINDYEYKYAMPRYYKDKLYSDEQKQRFAEECSDKAAIEYDKKMLRSFEENEKLLQQKIQIERDQIYQLKQRQKRKKIHL